MGQILVGIGCLAVGIAQALMQYPTTRLAWREWKSVRGDGSMISSPRKYRPFLSMALSLILIAVGVAAIFYHPHEKAAGKSQDAHQPTGNQSASPPQTVAQTPATPINSTEAPSAAQDKQVYKPCPQGTIDIDGFRTKNLTESVTTNGISPCIKIKDLEVEGGKRGLVTNQNPAAAQPQQIPSAPPVTVQCDQNTGNCAGINNGQQITNQFGAVKKTLSDSQIAEITAVAETLPSNDGGKGFIICQLGNDNSCSVANRLSTAFENAGWNDKRIGLLEAIEKNAPDKVLLVINPPAGVEAGQFLAPDIPVPAGVRELAILLARDGISVSVGLDPKVAVGTFRIEVGNQP